MTVAVFQKLLINFHASARALPAATIKWCNVRRTNLVRGLLKSYLCLLRKLTSAVLQPFQRAIQVGELAFELSFKCFVEQCAEMLAGLHAAFNQVAALQ